MAFYLHKGVGRWDAIFGGSWVLSPFLNPAPQAVQGQKCRQNLSFPLTPPPQRRGRRGGYLR